MALHSLFPRNGAISLGAFASTGLDFASFDIDAGQAVDVVTPYGSGTCSKNVGSGTPDFVFTIGAFGLQGATTAAPQLPGVALGATTGLSLFLGGSGTGQTQAATFTLDTGCTESCNVVTNRFRLSHARMRGFAPIALTCKNANDITESWITS
jgi:hypothetical protein